MSSIADQLANTAGVLSRAEKAIKYVLCQIHDRPEVGWYLGFGTETFAQLTESYTALTEANLEAIIERFKCPNAANPATSSLAPDEDEEDLTLRETIEQLAIADRLELLQELRDGYCFHCGGRTPVKPCFCRPMSRRQMQIGGVR